MFWSVIAGYSLCAALTCCGLARLVSYVHETDWDKGGPAFMCGLPEAIWPLTLAVALLILIELACMVEKIHFHQKLHGLPATTSASPAPVRAKKKKAAAEEEEGGFFRTNSPRGQESPPAQESVARPPHPAAAAPTAAPTTSPTAAVVPPIYNPDAPPADKEEEARPRSSGLSFFKID